MAIWLTIYLSSCHNLSSMMMLVKLYFSHALFETLKQKHINTGIKHNTTQYSHLDGGGYFCSFLIISMAIHQTNCFFFKLHIIYNTVFSSISSMNIVLYVVCIHHHRNINIKNLKEEKWSVQNYTRYYIWIGVENISLIVCDATPNKSHSLCCWIEIQNLTRNRQNNY